MDEENNDGALAYDFEVLEFLQQRKAMRESLPPANDGNPPGGYREKKIDTSTADELEKLISVYLEDRGVDGVDKAKMDAFKKAIDAELGPPANEGGGGAPATSRLTEAEPVEIFARPLLFNDIGARCSISHRLWAAILIPAHVAFPKFNVQEDDAGEPAPDDRRRAARDRGGVRRAALGRGVRVRAGAGARRAGPAPGVPPRRGRRGRRGGRWPDARGSSAVSRRQQVVRGRGKVLLMLQPYPRYPGILD